ERETVQGRGFERCDEAALFDPVRLAVFALEQMLARRLDPLRLDGGDHAREQARRFHEACGHDPFRRLGSERRTWCDDEPRAAGAFVFPALIERADLTEKACENGLMQIGVLGGRRVLLELQLPRDFLQLSMQLLPLAHAHERHEVLAAPFAELTPAQRTTL